MLYLVSSWYLSASSNIRRSMQQLVAFCPNRRLRVVASNLSRADLIPYNLLHLHEIVLEPVVSAKRCDGSSMLCCVHMEN
jgi:hypothetical protein